MKNLKSSNKSKNVLLISGLPEFRKPDIRFFHIQYPARYWIAEKWPDFAGYRILNWLSGPSLLFCIKLGIQFSKNWISHQIVIWSMPRPCAMYNIQWIPSSSDWYQTGYPVFRKPIILQICYPVHA